jgi:hypothetical protein
MPECYNCGAWIERGMGVRRNVNTGTISRIYLTRHGGGSLGFVSGRRTVCASCASVMDRMEEGGCARVIIFLVAYACSFVLGFKMLMNDGPLMGLLFILGVPVFIPLFIYESRRREGILRGAGLYPAETFQPFESALDWVDRVLPKKSDLSYDLLVQRSVTNPPEVGQTLQEWVESWEVTDRVVAMGPAERLAAEYGPDFREVETAFREDDTITSWAARAAFHASNALNCDFDEMRTILMNFATLCKPIVGETLPQYRVRFEERSARINLDADPESAASARQDHESTLEWLQRTVPTHLSVDEGESYDDVIGICEKVALRYPPRSGESIAAWCRRASQDLTGV